MQPTLFSSGEGFGYVTRDSKIAERFKQESDAIDIEKRNKNPF